MAACQGAEIGAIIDQTQVKLLSRTLIAQSDHSVHHLLQISTALEEIGLQAFEVVIFDPFLQPDLIPAIAQRPLHQLGLSGNPITLQAGGGRAGHPLPKPRQHHGLLFSSESDGVPQALN